MRIESVSSEPSELKWRTSHHGMMYYYDLEQLPEIDRQFLVERQLVSREIAEADGARGVAVSSNEHFSVMVNEEDHLRIQVMHSGLDLLSG